MKNNIKKYPYLFLIAIAINTIAAYVNLNLFFKQQNLQIEKNKLLLEISHLSKNNHMKSTLKQQTIKLTSISEDIQKYYEGEKFTNDLQSLSEKYPIKVNEIHISSNHQLKINISGKTQTIIQFLCELLKRFSAISINEISMQGENMEAIINLPNIQFS